MGRVTFDMGKQSPWKSFLENFYFKFWTMEYLNIIWKQEQFLENLS